MKRVKAFLAREYVVLVVYVAVSVIIGVQHYVGGALKYNNFLIFRQSLFHFFARTNLHIPYPSEYYDLFLYHPSFSLLFSPFSLLPISIGLILWLLACSLCMFYGIRTLPISQNHKTFFWWYTLIELITSLHNQQTNPIIAAMGLFTFSCLEKGKVKWAALFPILAFCIKGYGLIFAAIFVFYPKRGEYVLYSLLWLMFFAFLPLPFVGGEHFVQLYRDWLACLIQDHTVNFGFSIMGLVKLWVPALTDPGVMKIQYLGVVLFACIWLWVLLKGQYRSVNNRLLLLAYASLWVIMFNHAAESPTYIIAVQGVALWYIASREQTYPWGRILIVVVFLFSILAPTDLYPPSLRQIFFQPYLVKVIPCFFVWLFLQIQLIFSTDKQYLHSND